MRSYGRGLGSTNRSNDFHARKWEAKQRRDAATKLPKGKKRAAQRDAARLGAALEALGADLGDPPTVNKIVYGDVAIELDDVSYKFGDVHFSSGPSRPTSNSLASMILGPKKR